MYNVATIYRFKTPFLDVKKEINSIWKIITCSEEYIKSEWLDYKTYLKKNDSIQVLSIDIKNFWKIVFSFLIWEELLKEKFYPVFTMDIYFYEKVLDSNKKGVVNFLTNIFECFDGVNEREYLIEIDKSIYYKKWFLWKKIYPKYDFQDIATLSKDFKQKEGIKLLSDFLKKYNNWFVLNMYTADEYHKVNGYLLYFLYLLFIMHKVLYWIDSNLNLIESIETEKSEYKWHLLLQKKKLKVLWDVTKKTYEKYLLFLEKFLGLFE